MIWRAEATAGVTYQFGPDDPPLVTGRVWAIATAQLVDEITGDPIRVPFRARVVLPGAESERAQDGTWVRRADEAIAVKPGADGTLALIARPWRRFSPFVAPASVTVRVDASGFLPLVHAFPIAYDQRLVAAAAVGIGGRTVTLDTTAGLAAGQVLLFGPAATPQYVRIQSIAAGNVVTLAAGLISPQAINDPVFPDTFTAPAPTSLALRRIPLRVSGRVVRRHTATGVSTPVAGALIAVSDFWRTRADVVANPAHGAMTDPNPALRRFTVALTPGALAARAVGGTVGVLLLPPVASDDRALTVAAEENGTRLAVSRRQNLLAPPSALANRLLLVDAGDPDVAEFHTIAAVQAAGAAEEPARLQVELPLHRSHGDGARVSRINPGPMPAATQALRDAALPGDHCVFLDGLAALPAAGAVRIAGGGAVDEFQRYEQLVTVSGADGEYAMPPLHRMARVALRVDDGAGHVQVVEFDPEYGEREQRLDVVYLV